MKTSSGKYIFERPSFFEENTLNNRGYTRIAGIDEAGRGALAGPVVAAAVILPPSANLARLSEVRDSKEVLPSKRELLFNVIYDESVAVGVGVIQSQTIDLTDILTATRLAMCKAVEQLACSPDFLLIDGLTIPRLSILQKGIIKGDKLCLSIACASIIAKVVRDRIMVELDSIYPGYGLARHKGYGTEFHLSCLSQRGPLPIHRYSFAPVKHTAESR